MPKIVFVNRYFDPDQSATSQLLTDLARGLVQRGLEVHVVCSRQKYDDPDARLVAREVRFGVVVHRVATTRFGRHRLPGRAMDYASFYVGCVLKLLRLLRRGDALVAKTDPPLLSIVAAPLTKAKRVLLINWQQDIFPEIASLLGANPLPRFLDVLLKRGRDASLRSAVMNVVIGGRMQEYLSARGVQSSKLRVIENWADGHAIQPKAVSASFLRASLELLGRFVVCYSGNLGRPHEFDTLLGAAQVLEEDSRFVFLVIGGGAKMETLKRAVSLRALSNFRFLPYQPRDALDDSLAAADVHLVSLLPALEGLIVPSKMYGILAAGRPLIFIGDPDGETGRVVRRAQCGRLVSVGDSAALADALMSLAADPAGCGAMGKRARRMFSDEFSRLIALDRWQEVIDSAFKENLSDTRMRAARAMGKL